MNPLDVKKHYLITGSAGFIGFHLCKHLLDKGIKVIGLDNMNDYYEVSLKEDRLKKLEEYENFTFIKGDISDKKALFNVFRTEKPDIVINLAAQAGVRYSIDNPDVYIQSNIVGFFNILEACRNFPVKHLVYASSSSVYGGNDKVPFSIEDKTEQPVSLYAATKKSNELMAYSYSKLYSIPATGLRFFTVYGPYGRPDMACYKFAKKIMNNESIELYNYGDMYRDFTYINDIIKGIVNILCNPPKEDRKGVSHKIYNIGNNQPEKLMDFVCELEKCLGREAKKDYLPMQPGDVYKTFADVEELMKDFNFKPDTPMKDGMKKFVDWFMEYYGYEKTSG